LSCHDKTKISIVDKVYKKNKNIYLMVVGGWEELSAIGVGVESAVGAGDLLFSAANESMTHVKS
jgi:hypothetical protein